MLNHFQKNEFMRTEAYMCAIFQHYGFAILSRKFALFLAELLDLQYRHHVKSQIIVNKAFVAKLSF